MTSNWKTLALQAMVVWTLAAAPVHAEDQKDKPPAGASSKGGTSSDRSPADLAEGTLEGDIKKLKKDLADLKVMLSEIQAAQKAKSLTKQIDSDQIRDQVRQAIKDELADLRKELGESRRSAYAGSPPTGSSGARVRLINRYMEQQTVLVNGRSYGLAPGETRTVDVAPGEFVYEVRGVTEPRPRTVQASEMFTIDIHPQ